MQKTRQPQWAGSCPRGVLEGKSSHDTSGSTKVSRMVAKRLTTWARATSPVEKAAPQYRAGILSLWRRADLRNSVGARRPRSSPTVVSTRRAASHVTSSACTAGQPTCGDAKRRRPQKMESLEFHRLGRGAPAVVKVRQDERF